MKTKQEIFWESDFGDKFHQRINTENNLVEIVEIENHPWFVGAQFHPEYKSTVINPHPLFVNFVKASTIVTQQKLQAVNI